MANYIRKNIYLDVNNEETPIILDFFEAAGYYQSKIISFLILDFMYQNNIKNSKNLTTNDLKAIIHDIVRKRREESGVSDALMSFSDLKKNVNSAQGNRFQKKGQFVAPVQQIETTENDSDNKNTEYHKENLDIAPEPSTAKPGSSLFDDDSDDIEINEDMASMMSMFLNS